MKTIVYQYRCTHTGLTYRVRIRNVETIADEPYPPGGFLRVCRDASGRALCGPLVSEIVAWSEAVPA